MKRNETALEKMGEFFDSRLDIYDEHQLNCIEGAREFYPFTASLLPKTKGCRILDLGCGTGLELREYFKLNPRASVVGIDLARGMLGRLRETLPDMDLTLICGSYFETPLGESEFDAAVSVESLHHFTFEQKTALYRRLRASLKDGGYFVLTDYAAADDEAEREGFKELTRLKERQGAAKDELLHFDTPLTAKREIEALSNAGFSSVEILKKWASTVTIIARK